MKFLRRCCFSLLGNIFIFALATLLLFFVISVLTYFDGNFSSKWALRAFLYCILIGPFGGVWFWFTTTRPLLKRRQ